MSRLTNEARLARKEFRRTYGPGTFQIVDAITRGWNNERIQAKFDIPRTSISTYRANVTRGAYYPFIEYSNEGQAGTMYESN